MAQFQYDMDKNDISFIRFGNTGAAGSEGWMRGQKMKPCQIKKLEELLKTVKGEPVLVEKNNDENLESMFD